jgi:DNA-binding protein H-NS
MSNYRDYLKQIEELTRKAEAARREETAAAIADIKQKIRQFGLTAEDVGLAARAPRGATKTAASRGAAKGPGRKAATRKGAPSAQKGVKRKVKYRGPEGQPWSGVGRKPVWLVDALAAGRTLEEFAVQQ